MRRRRRSQLCGCDVLRRGERRGTVMITRSEAAAADGAVAGERTDGWTLSGAAAAPASRTPTPLHCPLCTAALRVHPPLSMPISRRALGVGAVQCGVRARKRGDPRAAARFVADRGSLAHPLTSHRFISRTLEAKKTIWHQRVQLRTQPQPPPRDRAVERDRRLACSSSRLRLCLRSRFPVRRTICTCICATAKCWRTCCELH